jgi:hypothetical protein
MVEKRIISIFDFQFSIVNLVSFVLVDVTGLWLNDEIGQLRNVKKEEDLD